MDIATCRACKFTGSTSSYIELPNDSRIKSNSVSFSCWVKLDVLNSLQYIVFAKNTCVAWFEGYALTASDVGGQVRFHITKSSSSGVGCGTSGALNSSGTFNPYIWHHVAFYVDNSTLKLYVDGSAQGSTSSAVVLNYDNTNVYLGGTNVSYFNYPLNGSIDNVRIYNRELTASEVSGIAGYDPPCDAIVPCGGNPSNCRPAIPSGIQNHGVAGDRVDFYPNPSSGKIYVSNPKDKSFIVYDINGKIVQHTFSLTDETKGEINLLNSAPGIYLIRISDSKGNAVQASKIIINN